MAQQIINLGATGSGAGGDSARTAFEKAIANFAELYIAALPGTAAQKQAARDVFGLGTAATKAAQTGPTDTTAGALMAVGAGGLLGSSGTSVIDEATLKACPGGFHYTTATDMFALAGPLLVSRNNSRGFALHARSSRVTVVTYSPNDGEATQVLPLYHPRNILGTVSQANGLPTGAIFQNFETAAGFVTLYANGDMECRGTFSKTVNLTSVTAVSGGFRCVGETVPLPATFVGPPTVTATNRFPESSYMLDLDVTVISPGTSSFTVSFAAKASLSNQLVACNWVAKGRWY